MRKGEPTQVKTKVKKKVVGWTTEKITFAGGVKNTEENDAMEVKSVRQG